MNEMNPDGGKLRWVGTNVFFLGHFVRLDPGFDRRCHCLVVSGRSVGFGQLLEIQFKNSKVMSVKSCVHNSNLLKFS
jgi:hypothetical protein